MSASDLLVEAENFRYGFLAAELRDVLQKPIGTALGDTDVSQLDAAARFLQDVIDGARLISGGAPAAARPHSIEALGRMLDPITAIDRYRHYNAQELLQLFGDMHQFLTRSVSERALAGTANQRDGTAEVFAALNASILAYLHRQARADNGLG